MVRKTRRRTSRRVSPDRFPGLGHTPRRAVRSLRAHSSRHARRIRRTIARRRPTVARNSRSRAPRVDLAVSNRGTTRRTSCRSTAKRGATTQASRHDETERVYRKFRRVRYKIIPTADRVSKRRLEASKRSPGFDAEQCRQVRKRDRHDNEADDHEYELDRQNGNP